MPTWKKRLLSDYPLTLNKQPCLSSILLEAGNLASATVFVALACTNLAALGAGVSNGRIGGSGTRIHRPPAYKVISDIRANMILTSSRERSAALLRDGCWSVRRVRES